jgi:hypothetical protein
VTPPAASRCASGNTLDVIARRELRDNTAVSLVHRHLRMQGVRKEPALAVVDRKPGFVAGRLDAED